METGYLIKNHRALGTCANEESGPFAISPQ